MNKMAGAKEGIILILIGCLPILGTLIIAPVLPAMSRHFSDVPQVAFLVPFVQTSPALVLALTGLFAGVVVNRVGRKKLLLGSLALYIIAAPLPLYLETLNSIIISRLFVGLAEAGLMTASTTLIGDYFDGKKRERYLGLQVLTTSVSAVLFITLGGILGAEGWRMPFIAYLFPVFLIPCVWLFLWEPAPQLDNTAAPAEPASFPWRTMLPVLIVTFFAGLCMNLMSVEIGFIVDGMGEQRPEMIGLIAALNSAGIVCGSLLFSSGKTNSSSPALLCGAILVAAAGYLFITIAGSTAAVTLAGFLAGAGAGFYLPWLLAATNRKLDFRQRSLGVGLFMSVYFIAVVMGPPAATVLAGMTGSLQSAMGVFAVILSILSAFAFKSRSTQAVQAKP